MRLVGCFPTGAVHAQNYHVEDIPAGLMTRVIFAFAGFDGGGRVRIGDATGDCVNFRKSLDLKHSSARRTTRWTQK
jgi:GH18 family chitinase